VWPLQTVETEINGDQRVQMKEVLLWLDRCDFCSALAALVSTEQNTFSSPNTISIHLSPAPSSRAGSPVSLYVSLRKI
jgi:hypothetical protein